VKKHLGQHPLLHMPTPVLTSPHPLLPQHFIDNPSSVLAAFVVYLASFRFRLARRPGCRLRYLWHHHLSALDHIVVFSASPSVLVSACPSPCLHSPALAGSRDGKSDLVVEDREGCEVRNNHRVRCRMRTRILSGVMGHGTALEMVV